MTSAQAKQARQANKKRRPPDFHTGDLVFVTKKLWRTDRPSDKLDNPVAGPFRILEMVGHSYRLELPSSYRISPVLHADRLRKADNNPLPGQIPTPPPAVEVDGDLEWEVEKILSSRLVSCRQPAERSSGFENLPRRVPPGSRSTCSTPALA